MSFKQRILFGVILFAFLVVCYTTIASNYQAPKHTSNNFPRWIAEEKIRAGYLHVQHDDIKYASFIRAHGLNTLILKGNLHSKNGLKQVLDGYRRWARAAKKEDLHLFIAFNWQPGLRGWSYKPVVYSDGRRGIAPCPQDREYWDNYLRPLGKAIAMLSLESGLQVDGIHIDSELYGSRKRGFGDYGKDICFCDRCFSHFLLAKGYSGPELPPVGASERKKWLAEQGLLDSYFVFLSQKVELHARNLEQELHRINPNLILGIYPTPRDWARKAVFRGFGTKEFPTVIFATDSYEGGGAARIPEYPRKFYAKKGINGVYSAGFLFRCYGADDLERELALASKQCSGYWLYHMSMLWGRFANHESLPNGTELDYWQAIKKANNKIDGLTGEP